MYEFSDYLAHHGVLGQKWGKQNGPPYPLSPGQHSASEKKAGWKKSLSGGGSSSESTKKKKGSLVKSIISRAAKRREESFEEKKERILRTGSAKDVLKIKKHLSEAELKRATDRINNETSLAEAGNRSRKAFLERMAAPKNVANIGLQYAKTVIDAYDTIQNINSRLTPKAKTASQRLAKEALGRIKGKPLSELNSKEIEETSKMLNNVANMERIRKGNSKSN